MDGVLVVDKPEGLTSHDVVAVARRALRESRIGHTGTLDPLATGVLPLAIGRATRLVRFLSASDKDYEATIRFGFTTDTYDIAGTETSRSGLQPDRDAVLRALAALSGEYLQTPPAFSAKKVAGHRAYNLARAARGVPGAPPSPDGPARPVVELTPVPVTVTRVELLSFEGTIARVAMTCSAGFYVRSFAHSMGALVGTGACLEALRRTRSGDFGLGSSVTVEDLQIRPALVDERVVPLDRLLERFPAVAVDDQERKQVSRGQDVHASVGAPWVRLLDAQGHLIALARPGARPGSLHPTVVLI